MGQALYRKYRSKKLSELVGQEHITQTLEQAIQSGRISHAYLFTGPRGVGKTSTARILAHEINGLPYSDGQTHLDIIEIDAASNNSVEDIRDLREKVYVAPASGKYKVYIIDEVHMLSKAAFNAILKTLEEPPAHAVFILATTEAHKLPETIISRTQRFTFRPIEPAKAVEHLKHIAKIEHIKITDEALELLAVHGDGSFRDSISLLDQASSSAASVDASVVRSLLGMPSAEAIERLSGSLTGTGSGNALQTLYSLYDQGFQAASIAKELSTSLRHKLLQRTVASTPELLQLLTDLLEVPVSHDPERFLEILILKAGIGPAQSDPVPKTQESTPAPEQLAEKSAERAVDSKKHETHTSDVPAKPAKREKQAVKAPKAATPVHTSDSDEAVWPEVLGELRKQYNTLYGIVRMAAINFTSQDELELSFAFAFHQKRVNESKNRKIISDTIEKLTGRKVHIICLHDPDLKLAKKKPAATLPPAHNASPEPLSAISNIFGGGELLES